MLKIIFFILFPGMLFAATETEGFIRKQKDGFYIEKGLDSKAIYPEVGSCEPDKISKFKDHYVLVDWEKDEAKSCFKTLSVKRIVYDPLRGTLSPFRKKK